MAFNTTLKHFTSSQELASIWATGENYLLNQLVLENDVIYRCAIAHTSGATFATDLGAGKWVAVSAAGASGSKNYIENGDFEDNNTTGWSLFNTTINSTTKIPTGSIVAGAAGFNALSVSGSSPLAGSYSLSVSTAAGVTITTTGYGFISDAFTIDREDQAKVMGFSFYYEAVSGTMNFSGTSSNTFAVYIRDVSGGAWIQPAGVYNLVQSSGSGICSGTFQTTATGTQYQIAVLMINTVSATVSIKFDDFQLGPQKVLAGAAITDWQQYTATLTNLGNATQSMYWRRVGDSIQIQGRITIGSVLPTVTLMKISIPSGFTFDTTKTSGQVGVASAIATGSVYTGSIFRDSVTGVSIYGDDGVSFWNNVNPITFATNDNIDVVFSAPISGWSSNTVMSQDTDTRVVAARANSPSITGFTSTPTNPVLNNKLFDTHAAYNTSTGVYSVPVSGYYKVTYAGRMANLEAMVSGTTAGTSIYKNSSLDTVIGTLSISAAVTPSNGFHWNGSGIVYANAGDTLEIRNSHDMGGTKNLLSTAANGAFNWVSFERLSGPATIAASEFVGASFTGCLTTLSSGGATLVFPGSGKIYDSHGAMNTSTGIYTVPVSGKYSLSCFLITTQTTGTGSITIEAYQTGSTPRAVELQRQDVKTGLTASNGRKLLQGDATFNCLAGDTLYVVGYDPDATSAIAGTRLSITRIG